MSADSKLLLFGANGQVGYEVRRLFSNDHEVIAVDRDETAGCTPLDFTNLDALSNLILTLQPSIIVNAAAYTQVDKAQEEYDTAKVINADAPALIAKIAREIGATLVHYSTDYVYSSYGDKPMDEETPARPINRYGESKLIGDQKVLTSGANALIFRTSWVFGVHGHNFVKTMLRLGSEREELSVVSDQIGSPTSAATLAQATRHVLDIANLQPKNWFELNRGVYHLTNTGYTSWHGFAEEIFRQARSRGFTVNVNSLHPIPSSHYPTPARRPLNSRLLLGKLNQQLGFYPKSWQQALSEDFFDNLDVDSDL